MADKDYFCCKGIRLANYLIENKCTITRIDKDKLRWERVVFIFLNDGTLENALLKWREDKYTYNYR